MRLIILVAAGLLISLSIAHAQDETAVSVLPAESNIVLNGANTGEVEINITSGVNVNAFDISITYDGNLLALEEVVLGDYLSNLSKIIEINNSGFYRLGVFQVATPGVYGDGTLLHLTFSGVAPGVSAITITSIQLSTPEGSGSFPPVNHGTLRAFYEIPLSGTVMLQGQTSPDGVTFSLDTGTVFQMGPYSAVSQDLIGANVDFGTVVGDTYGITAAFPRYIALTQDSGRTVTISPDKTALNPLRLLSGNALWTDNVIDALDVALVRADYLKTINDLGEGESLDGDVNYDGVVDLKDLALVGGNYGFSSADAYDDWVP
jgi:hypothetical protein